MINVHPGTMQPYIWPKRSPCDVSLTDLTVTTEAEARDVIDEVEAILRDAGGILRPEKDKSGTEPLEPRHKHDRPLGEGDSLFRAVNTRALSNIPAWVTALDKRFHNSGSSWRLSSKELGRISKKTCRSTQAAFGTLATRSR